MRQANCLNLRRRVAPALTALLLGGGIVKCQGPTVDATQWYVSLQGKDSNSCHTQLTPCRTIAGALKRAVEGDTVHIDAGVFSENLVVDKSITMVGAGIDQTLIDGGQQSTVLRVDGEKYPGGMDFSLSGVTLTHGSAARGAGLSVSGGKSIALKDVRVDSNVAYDQGGGILDNYAMEMTLDDVTVSNNITLNEGGGIYFSTQMPHQEPNSSIVIKLDISNSLIEGNRGDPGGGIYSEGDLTMTNTTVKANHTKVSGGGGLYTDAVATIDGCLFEDNTGGGGIESEERGYGKVLVTIRNSTISGNQGKVGGGISNSGDMSLAFSTVSNNQASYVGGGISIGEGVGLETLTYILNSTISGNSAPEGGGIYVQGACIYTHCSLTTTNVTVADNQGGGIFISGFPSSLRDSLFALNAGGNCSYTTHVTESADLSDDLTCGGFLQADPMIGPLKDNGGPTMTHALMPGSPAIDAGVDWGLSTDQRGVKRPLDGDGDGVAKTDIGAYEYDQPPLVLPTRSILVATSTAPAVITFTPHNLNPYCLRGPDSAFSPIGVAMQGQVYSVEGRSEGGNWLFIRLSEKVDCWVPLSTGTASGDLSLVPGLVSPPTPVKCIKSPTHPCP
jgi:hypothetical protein